MTHMKDAEVPHLFQSRHPPARGSTLGSIAEGGGKEPHPFEGGGARARELERRRRELERASVDCFGGRLDLPQQRVHIDAPMGRRVAR